jgi:predicted DNA-binding protein (MmcQ/YjbR family)
VDRAAAQRVRSPLASAFGALLRTALSYPEAWEDHPWGETVVKVGKKIFVFLSRGDGALHVTCKLPQTGEAALSMLSFAEPTGYGLGRSGWVTATFADRDKVPVEMLHEWMDESYRAIAPKKLVQRLAQAG